MGQAVATPGLDTTQLATKAYADTHYIRRNRIINGAMQISQELGETPTLGPAGSATVQLIDQWVVGFNMAASGLVATVTRAAVTTPLGSKHRLRYTVNTGGALTASDYIQCYQRIEGNMVADFMFGTASAKQMIVCFGFKGPAGTYSIAIKNSATARTYQANFTITAGQPTRIQGKSFIIPGDTTGGWGTEILSEWHLY